MTKPRSLSVPWVACGVVLKLDLSVEGALGQSLPGAWVQAQDAGVGPNPGFNFTTFPISYMGSIGGGRQVPNGSSAFAVVDAKLGANFLAPQYVDKTETRRVSVASRPSWLSFESEGSLQFDGLSRRASRSNAGMGAWYLCP
jgi:hypothetical protein